LHILPFPPDDHNATNFELFAMFQTSHTTNSPQHQQQHDTSAAIHKTLVFDGDASVNSGLSLTSSRASLALTASTLGSQASPMFSNNNGGAHNNFLFSQRLGNNDNTSQRLGGFGGASADLLSFRMPTVQLSSSQTAQSGEYYGSCFVDEASCEQLWVASCIDESVTPQRRPGNGHVKHL
jgi:hypothetical protein